MFFLHNLPCQLLFSLEGVRLYFEVCARLYVTGEPSVGDRLVQTQLNRVCLAWESAVYRVCATTPDRQDALCNVCSYIHTMPVVQIRT